MRETLPTLIGDFTLDNNYQQLPNDRRLNRLTVTIDKESVYPILAVLKTHPTLKLYEDIDKISKMAISVIDESVLENKLNASTKIFGNAGLKISLNLKKKEIQVSDL